MEVIGKPSLTLYNPHLDGDRKMINAPESTPRAAVIRAIRNWSSPGAYVVTIRCPLCAEKHIHGAPTLDDLRRGMGDRAGHCRRPGSGYVIEPYAGPISRPR